MSVLQKHKTSQKISHLHLVREFTTSRGGRRNVFISDNNDDALCVWNIVLLGSDGGVLFAGGEGFYADEKRGVDYIVDIDWSVGACAIAIGHVPTPTPITMEAPDQITLSVCITP